MSDAMHFAEELSGQFRNQRKALAAISVSDPAHITCAANDLGFEHIFSRYVEAIGQQGDVLLAISTSGNSPNIIHAALAAKEKGMIIVGLTGKDGGKLAPLCHVEIRAPFSEFSDRIQEIHIKIIHSLIHYIELNIS
jgi:D-sedoheptulose 7-phosphate isomerase